MTRPMLKRDSAPAPLARISGMTPNTIAAVVIRIGRSLIPAACSMASRLAVPLSCSSLANSTIRMPCLLIRPISVTRPPPADAWADKDQRPDNRHWHRDQDDTGVPKTLEQRRERQGNDRQGEAER